MCRGMSAHLANRTKELRKTVKEISWSYPSSPNAVALGFGRVGCFTVSAAGKPISGHRSVVDAVNAADALPFEYGRHSMQFTRASYEQADVMSDHSAEVAATI